MSIKELLKPEWKKFILPVAFIILFFVAINSFYYVGSSFDKYGCDQVSLSKELQSNLRENNTLAYNQTWNKLRSLSENWSYEIMHTRNVRIISDFVKMIDPIIPVPCEFGVGAGVICEIYMNEETYNCFNSQGDATMFPFEPKYKKASAVTFGFNVLLLFAEGYLISSVVLFAYREMRISSVRKKIRKKAR